MSRDQDGGDNVGQGSRSCYWLPMSGQPDNRSLCFPRGKIILVSPLVSLEPLFTCAEVFTDGIKRNNMKFIQI